MRVLHVTSTFPKEDGDTTGPFLGDLVAAESSLGLDVHVLAPHAPGLLRDGTVGGVAVHRFRYGPPGWERLGYGAGLLATSRSPGGAAMVPAYVASMIAAATAQALAVRPDVIHAHWWFPGGVAGAVAARAVGCPYLVTLHGSDVGLARRWGLSAAAKRVFLGAAAVVAVSEALAAEASVTTGIPRERVGVAVMPVVVEPATAQRPGRSGPVHLLSVGRLAPEKGFDVLIDAMALSDPSITLDVIGAGPLAEDLGRRAAALGGRVRLLGSLPRSEYHARLRAADALVVPSRREGLGLVAVEAVLMGTPVVASDTGGLPGVLGATAGPPAGSPREVPADAPGGGSPTGVRAVPGGLLVTPDDPAALASALARVRELGPPGPEALAAAARHQPEAVALRHRDLYQEAMTGGGSLRGS